MTAAPAAAAPLGARPASLWQVPPDSAYGAAAETLERIGVPGAHRMGLTGAGVRVGILAGAFLTSHQALASTLLVASRDFVDGDDSVDPGADPSIADRGTAVWSLAGASASGFFLGPAFGASYVLARTFSPTGAPREDEDRWIEGLEWLESQGVRIVISGAGFRIFDDGFMYATEDLDGATAEATIAATRAKDRGVLVVTPVGDGGPGVGTLIVPADGSGIGAIGAVTQESTVASFSAMGPTADGREKPDLLAPGVDIPVAATTSASAIEAADGTALAAALVAGASALFAEAHPTRSPSEIIAALAASASARTGAPLSAPVIDVGSAIAFPDGILSLPLTDVDASGVLTTLIPLFEWDVPTLFPQALPVSYTILVASDSTFQDILLAERVVGTFARRLARPLPARRQIYWRVDGETAQGITRRTVSRGPLTVPAWLRLTTLNDPGGTSIQERRPLFTWQPFEVLEPPAGPFQYDVSVFNDRDGTPVTSAEALDTAAFRPPDPLPLNVPLRWQVVSRVPSGQADTATSVGPFVVTSSASPPATILFQNFPNPFPQGGLLDTKIWFDLHRSSDVRLTVYDLRGRLVRRLAPAPGCAEVVLEPGMYGREGLSPDPCLVLRWDGTDDSGREVAPGVYLLRLQAAGVEDIRRMVYWP